MPRFHVARKFTVLRDDYSERHFANGDHDLSADDPDIEHFYFKANAVLVPGAEPEPAPFSFADVKATVTTPRGTFDLTPVSTDTDEVLDFRLRSVAPPRLAPVEPEQDGQPDDQGAPRKRRPK